jgi:3-oxoacyl-[acyl-carrier protein] reductase
MGLRDYVIAANAVESARYTGDWAWARSILDEYLATDPEGLDRLFMLSSRVVVAAAMGEDDPDAAAAIEREARARPESDAIADALAASGARVAIAGRDQKACDDVAAAVGRGAQGFACDLIAPGAAASLVESVEKAFGGVDVLVNNAGLTRDNLMLRMSDEDWDVVLNANLRGAFATMRAATRGMMKRRWGRIINIASVVGLIGNKGQANYAASKAGLIGLSKSVAREYASRNILVNVVAPGFIETEMTAAMTPEARTSTSAEIPLGRLGTPADVAALVVFLASEYASYITGQVLVVDGGMVM